MSCLPWPCYFGAVLFIFLEPVVYLGVVHLLGMVSTGLTKGSIRDVVFSQMVLDDYECMRGCRNQHLSVQISEIHSIFQSGNIEA